MIRRPPRSTRKESSAASDVYKRQDNEVDIAMTKLFGGFRKEFYEEYHRVFPIKNGFEKRIIIYNFYHILNHANMFGGGYLKQVKDYVKAILNM